MEGLSPTLAVEQRHSGGSGRSTLATSTEIHDHLRVLFATNGTPHDPKTGRPLLASSPSQIVDRLLRDHAGNFSVLLAPVPSADPARLKKEGFLRARRQGQWIDLGSATGEQEGLELVVDRLQIQDSSRARLADSVELALRLGQGRLVVAFTSADFAHPSGKPDLSLSSEPEDPQTGYRAPRLTPRHFSFNSPEGACPECSGLGIRLAPDPAKVVPHPELSLEKGAIAPWNRGHPRIRSFYRSLGRDLGPEISPAGIRR
jgi:excinuclease ABC subunit A